MGPAADQISFMQARQIAKDVVIRDMSCYATSEILQELEDNFLEAEHCWIFFRNRAIQVKPEHWFTRNYGAFAISKKGASSQITTFENDREQQLAYLQTMSDYFGRRGE